jgi:hypothetical protein
MSRDVPKSHPAKKRFNKNNPFTVAKGFCHLSIIGESEFQAIAKSIRKN